jgi:hypothetical protein
MYVRVSDVFHCRCLTHSTRPACPNIGDQTRSFEYDGTYGFLESSLWHVCRSHCNRPALPADNNTRVINACAITAAVAPRASWKKKFFLIRLHHQIAKSALGDGKHKLSRSAFARARVSDAHTACCTAHYLPKNISVTRDSTTVRFLLSFV